jgi:hypothetical protein
MVLVPAPARKWQRGAVLHNETWLRSVGAVVSEQWSVVSGQWSLISPELPFNPGFQSRLSIPAFNPGYLVATDH